MASTTLPLALIPSNNAAINRLAAEMASHTPKEVMHDIRQNMPEGLSTKLRGKAVEPIIYHFRVKATKAWREGTKEWREELKAWCDLKRERERQMERAVEWKMKMVVARVIEVEMERITEMVSKEVDVEERRREAIKQGVFWNDTEERVRKMLG